MSVTSEQMLAWCHELIAADSDATPRGLDAILSAIPRLNSLDDLPSGTPVLVRGDVDAKPGAEIGQGDIRLRSMLETLTFGRERGWRQFVFGHIGRKPEGSLAKVAQRLAQLLECDVPLVPDWLDETEMTINPAAARAIDSSAPGSVVVLENIRRYDIERVLWKARPDDLHGLSEPLSKFANQFAQRIATTYVNEALSAGSLDASSTVVPAAMQRVALGTYVARELSEPMMRCLKTELVIFSGLKIDKLDDLQAMISRGKIRLVFSAGSLAMALLKAARQLDGQQFCLGVAEDPQHGDQPYYIPPDRIEQAKRMISAGRSTGIEFLLPVDFVLQNGKTADVLGPSDQQLDVGPKTIRRFEERIGQYLSQNATGAVAFHNGVFGMFEDPRFEEGTKRFVRQLKRLTDAGVEVYVGGGEGGKALERYGSPDWVTHTFTAGGTVLNVLGGQPIPYLLALRAAAERIERQA